MAKSVGNIWLLSAALDEFGRDALVMYFVAGHYRQPLAFSPEPLEDAARSVGRLRELGRRLDPGAPDPEALDPYAERFFDALADDFNTPAARAALFDWVAEANRRLDAGETLGVGRLRDMLWAIGMEATLEPEEAAPDAEAERLLAEREEARSAREFATADAKRDELRRRGFEVRDTSEGPVLVPRR
jgi:cysteinyl-tRNA synthetase